MTACRVAEVWILSRAAPSPSFAAPSHELLLLSMLGSSPQTGTPAGCVRYRSGLGSPTEFPQQQRVSSGAALSQNARPEPFLLPMRLQHLHLAADDEMAVSGSLRKKETALSSAAPWPNVLAPLYCGPRSTRARAHETRIRHHQALQARGSA